MLPPTVPALDTPAEEVEPFVYVTDSRFLFRQPWTDRNENRRHLIPERFGVLSGPVDQDHEIIRIADEPHHRFSGATTLNAGP